MIEKIKQFIRYRKLETWIKQNERLLMPSMLLFGVIVDFITFRAIEISAALIVLAIHFIILGGAIILTHTAKHRLVRALAPLALQFSLGALLSASLIFYWFSGTLSINWPILLLIAALMISNDVFREQFRRPTVQISVLYFTIFSILTLALPHIFKTISVWTFISAGILSLLIIITYLKWTSHIHAIKYAHKPLKIRIAAIFIIMNVLYAFNMIPPIPLSLTDADVYHDITKSGNSYIIKKETENILQKIIPGKTIHITKGDRIYAFSSIFAPTDLNTTIYHQWDHYNKTQKRWIEKDTLSYPIAGGRENGYRGYSLKSDLHDGKWRVTIKTKTNQAVGRIKFNIKTQPEPPQTKTITK